MSKSLLVSLLVFLFPLITSCTSRSKGAENGKASSSPAPSTNTSTNVQGGQDGGGGFVTYSTPEQVRAAIDQALDLVLEPDFRKNIIYGFADYLFGDSTKGLSQWDILTGNHQLIKDVLALVGGPTTECLDPLVDGNRLMGAKLSPSPEIDEINKRYSNLAIITCNDHAEFKKYFVDLFAASPREVLTDRDCGWSGTVHADASVSDFHRGAKLCLSIPQLQRVPPQSLLREVLALLFHESLHLNGVDETRARIAQTIFSGYYDFEFSGVEREVVRLNINGILIDAYDHLQEAKSISQQDPHHPRAWARMGLVAEGLSQIPYLQSYLALRIAFQSKNPYAITAFTYSIFNFLYNADSWLNCPDQNAQCSEDASQLKDVNPNAQEWQNVSDKIASLQALLKLIDLNWQAVQNDGEKIDCSGFQNINDNYNDPKFIDKTVMILLPERRFDNDVHSECVVVTSP